MPRFPKYIPKYEFVVGLMRSTVLYPCKCHMGFGLYFIWFLDIVFNKNYWEVAFLWFCLVFWFLFDVLPQLDVSVYVLYFIVLYILEMFIGWFPFFNILFSFMWKYKTQNYSHQLCSSLTIHLRDKFLFHIIKYNV